MTLIAWASPERGEALLKQLSKKIQERILDLAATIVVDGEKGAQVVDLDLEPDEEGFHEVLLFPFGGGELRFRVSDSETVWIG